jgi:hypothetical protein
MSTADADDSTEVVVFDDLDFTIDADDEVEFTIVATLQSIADQLDAGDTIQVTFGETQTDLATFDAEDENGDNLSDADKTGTVTGEAHVVYDVAFNFDLVSATSSKTVGDPGTATSTDRGTFVIVYDLTAFGGDVSIDKSCVEDQANTPDQGTEYTAENEATDTCAVTSTADTNPNDSDAWVVREGETERFTLTVTATAADAFVRVYLTSINWDDDITDTTPDQYYTAGLGQDKTATTQQFLETY